MSKPKQLQLFLMPTPGAKPEFLATVEGTSKTPLDSSLPDKIVLENYTRDPWAWKPNPSVWQSFQVTSVDGRNKLPGFVNYLKQRQKSAYGRFGSTGVWIVSYVQQQPQQAAAGKNNPTGSQYLMDCRIGTDMQKIAHCSLKPIIVHSAAAKAASATKPPSQLTTSHQ